MNGVDDRLEVRGGDGDGGNGGQKERVAIVCPGPGAQMIRGIEHTYHRVVAVNRAILTAECTMTWVCLDAHTARWVVQKRGEHGFSLVAHDIVCSLAEYRNICGEFPGIKIVNNVEHTSLDIGQTDVAWKKFGASVALAVAAVGPEKLKPVGQIDVYGVGWKGEKDFDRFSDDRQRRDEDRWEEDKKVWLATARHLMLKGIRIRRMVSEWAEVLP